MSKYYVQWTNFTAAALTNPTLISAASRRIRLLSATITGQGATSVPQGVVMSRSATGTTPAGAITPSPAENSDQPASAFTTALTWATAPAGATNGEVLGFNALGGAFRWTSTQKISAPEARNGEVIVFKPLSGTTPQGATLTVLVEED